MVKITHLTSAHPRYDTRIFIKMCNSLAKIEKYKVNLIVADSLGDENKDNISIYDVGKLEGRTNRIFKTTKQVLYKAIELDSDIYHLHDPELIPIGIKLKKMGKRVIFDVHENISLQILNKEYLPKIIRKIFSKVYRIYELIQLDKFDCLILAEESYLDYYQKLSKNVAVVLNMPDIEPLRVFSNNKRNKNELFYIGRISNNRGFDVTVEALKIVKKEMPDIFMHYIGAFDEKLLENVELKTLKKNIKFYGPIPLLDGLKYSIRAKVGLSILKPIGNYINSYSTKIFEYMALELPVVTSNFKLYKDIVEKYNCGICVNPLNPQEIADAIIYIINNPEEAKVMGENGRKIVAERYNWGMEEKKLYNIYRKLESNCNETK